MGRVGMDAAGDRVMTLRRVVVGMTVVFGLSVWSWVRADALPDPVQVADEGDRGNRSDAAQRYRTSQARHWRQVMVGGTR